MPISGSPAPPDLSVLESRLSAARAAYLDELAAANVPTDLAAIIGYVDAEVAAILAAVDTEIAAILADVTGIAGAAMRGTDGVVVRGTDNALLAASYLGLTLTQYSYDAILADGVYFTPPDKTIVYTAHLENATIDAQGEFCLCHGTNAHMIVDAFTIEETPEKRSISRVVMCNGSTIKYKNNSGGGKTLRLTGVSLT